MNMLDRQTTLRQAALDRIRASHALEGSASHLGHFCRGRVRSYDLNIDVRTIVGRPSLQNSQAQFRQRIWPQKILAAPYGGDLAGGQLKYVGFQLLHGFDRSGEMAEKPRQTRVHRHIKSDVDLCGAAPATPVHVTT